MPRASPRSCGASPMVTRHRCSPPTGSLTRCARNARPARSRSRSLPTASSAARRTPRPPSIRRRLEAVQNASKHAGRDASVKIDLRREGNELSFNVHDTGKRLRSGSGQRTASPLGELPRPHPRRRRARQHRVGARLRHDRDRRRPMAAPQRIALYDVGPAKTRCWFRVDRSSAVSTKRITSHARGERSAHGPLLLVHAIDERTSAMATVALLRRGAGVSRCAPVPRPLRARRGPALGRSHLGGSACASTRPAARRFQWMPAWPVPCFWRNAGSWPLQMPVSLWPRRRHFHRASDPARGSAGACR